MAALTPKNIKDIHAIARHLTSLDPEDLAQEVCMLLHRNDRFDPTRSEKNFFRTILRNKAVDRVRRRRIKEELLADIHEYHTNFEPPKSISLSTLSVEEQFLVNNYYWRGMSSKTIALSMGLNINTVKSRLKRACCKLQLAMAGGHV